MEEAIALRARRGRGPAQVSISDPLIETARNYERPVKQLVDRADIAGAPFTIPVSTERVNYRSFNYWGANTTISAARVFPFHFLRRRRPPSRGKLDPLPRQRYIYIYTHFRFSKLVVTRRNSLAPLSDSRPT